jgi:hypothetical protein
MSVPGKLRVQPRLPDLPVGEHALTSATNSRNHRTQTPPNHGHICSLFRSVSMRPRRSSVATADRFEDLHRREINRRVFR